MNFTLTKVNKQLILLVSGVFLLGGSVYADVYKWKNTKGIMQYSDSPPSAITQKPSQRLLLSILKTQDYCANVSTKAKSSAGNADLLANFFNPVTVAGSSSGFGIGNINTGLTATSTLTTNSRLTTRTLTAGTAPSTTKSTNTTVASRLFGGFGFNTISPSTPFGVQRASVGTFGFGGQSTSTVSAPATVLAAAKPVTAITTAVPVVSATATNASGTNFMPFIDLSKIPFGSAGFSDVRIKPRAELASVAHDGVGAFRTICDFTHINNDDAIIFPGVKGAAHSHTYFGNTNANHLSTPELLASSGNSSCLGGVINRSAYWIPSVIDTATNAPVKPMNAIIYYKTGYSGVPNTHITVPPAGLRMISGDSKLTSANLDAPASVDCLTADFQNVYVNKKGIQPCGFNNIINLGIKFPQCWDGKNLDSPDHKSHMADAGNYDTANKCPASHPVAIPAITINVRYKVTSASGVANWRLASDNYAKSFGVGGFSLHADWINGWDQKFLTDVVKNCINPGKDCHAHLLGDNKEIF